jgi:hypothetical protein
VWVELARCIRRTTSNLGRDVAIKILPEAFAPDADRLTRFQREAKPKADFWSVRRRLRSMSLRSWLQANLPPSKYHSLVRIAKATLGWWYRDDLNRLALLFHTEKWGSHWYTQHYQRYFQSLKDKRLNVLEFGVGGYENSSEGGESLRMWKAYFRNSRIVGIDLYDKAQLCEHRIDIRQCDQTDAESLKRLSDEYGGFDIVIDDGSHLNEHVIKTFHVLFPLLRHNGIYVVEDLQTAYWPTWGVESVTRKLR